MARTKPASDKKSDKKRKQPESSSARFSNAQAERRFNAIFADKELWSEKGFVMADATTVDMPGFVVNQIAARGWHKFCTQPAGPVPEIVRELYASFTNSKATGATVRGVWVSFSQADINSLYQLPDIPCEFSKFLATMDDDTWDVVLRALTVKGTQWMISAKGFRSVKRLQLTPEAKVWHCFVKTSLMPTTHDTTVSQERLALIFCILSNIPINVGQVMLEQLQSCVTKLQGKLFFPCLISELCFKANVPNISEADRIQNQGLITPAYISRLMKEPVAEMPTPATTFAKTRSATAAKGSSSAPQPDVSHDEGRSSAPHFESSTDRFIQLESQLLEVKTLLQHSLARNEGFQQHILHQQQHYFAYRKKYDKALKGTLKRNCHEGLSKFPKFPNVLLPEPEISLDDADLPPTQEPEGADIAEDDAVAEEDIAAAKDDLGDDAGTETEFAEEEDTEEDKADSDEEEDDSA